jgi:hypothetical protein
LVDLLKGVAWLAIQTWLPTWTGFAGVCRVPPLQLMIEWKLLVVIQTPDAIEQSVPNSIIFASTRLRWTIPVKPILSPTRGIEPKPIERLAIPTTIVSDIEFVIRLNDDIHIFVARASAAWVIIGAIDINFSGMAVLITRIDFD